ncbi:MAG: carbamoyl-phosphate synthase domain-containing protein, partial [Planifilum fimeticola]
MRARLMLEDGTLFEGESFGADGEVVGEVVFNTGMTGYQEVLTDPSYCGQIVAMTYPLIGNVGLNRDEGEAFRPFVHGFVVRDYAEFPSHWRSEQTLAGWLKEHG